MTATAPLQAPPTAPPATLPRPLGDRLLCRRLEPETHRNGILIPEDARYRTMDARVLRAGPGRRWGRASAVTRCFAHEGDRVLFEENDWLDAPDLGKGMGWLSDGSLLGVIRGPEHLRPEAANDWVLVRPHFRGRITESDGTHGTRIAVARYSLGGGSFQEAQRAERRYHELKALEKSERWREAPTEYDRHRLVWDAVADLSQDELEQLDAVVAKRGDGELGLLKPGAYLGRPLTGTVVDYGPGVPFGKGPLPHVRKPLILGWKGGPLVGQKVHWDRLHQGVNVFLGGEELLAVRMQYLACVETETD